MVFLLIYLTSTQAAAVALSPRIGEGAYKLLGRGRKEREFLGRVGDTSVVWSMVESWGHSH